MGEARGSWELRESTQGWESPGRLPGGGGTLLPQKEEPRSPETDLLSRSGRTLERAAERSHCPFSESCLPAAELQGWCGRWGLARQPSGPQPQEDHPLWVALGGCSAGQGSPGPFLPGPGGEGSWWHTRKEACKPFLKGQPSEGKATRRGGLWFRPEAAGWAERPPTLRRKCDFALLCSDRAEHSNILHGESACAAVTA